MKEYFKNINWLYYIGYDYDIGYNCYANSCDTICRCGRIINEKITDGLDIKGFVKSFLGSSSECDRYALDRILHLAKAWDPEYFALDVEPGYYGAEITDAHFDNIDYLEEHWSAYNELSSGGAKIEYLLQLEYSFISKNIKNKSWFITTTTKDKIDTSGLIRKMPPIEITSHYQDWDLPRCICRPENDKWKIVDGHHRFLACQSDKIKIITFDPE